MSLQDLHPETTELLRRVFQSKDSGWPSDSSLTAERFVDDVVLQGMAPLVWHQIASFRDQLGWPPSVLNSLRTHAVKQAAAELFWDMELEVVLGALAKVNIYPLLLKGTALSHNLYPQPGLRPRCDTDMLLPPSSRNTVVSLMRGLGYEPLYDASVEYISSQISFFKSAKSGIGHSFDLHWRISNNDRVFSEAFAYPLLMERAIKLPDIDDCAWTLNTVDALIFACVHRAGHYSHSGDRLIWLYDIYLLVEAMSETESMEFCGRAEQLGFGGICADAILETRSWYGSHLSVNLASMLEKAANEQSTRGYLKPGRRAGIRGFAMRELKGLHDWKMRVSFLWQNIFPPPRYMLWRYHATTRMALPLLYMKRLTDGMVILLRK